MFSVIIPAYNSSVTIRQSVESVIAQTRIDLIEEIIIVDDGSADNTREIIMQLKEEYHQYVINYIFQDNAGPSSARNNGIRNAKAEWIALLDSDDIWLPEKLERQYEVISDHPDIKFLGAHYPVKVLFRNRRGLVKLSAYDLCIRSMPYTPSVVFERKKAIEFGLFNEDLRYNEDADLFQKFLLIDSYYILAEHLIEIDVGKDYFGQTGLSSHFREMYSGKKRNMQWLYEHSLINKPYLLAMELLCDIKLFRRTVQKKIHGIKKNY